LARSENGNRAEKPEKDGPEIRAEIERLLQSITKGPFPRQTVRGRKGIEEVIGLGERKEGWEGVCTQR